MNEDSAKGNGQIAEFLTQFNGEGIQHIAFITDDLLGTWDKLKALGAKFMTPPPNTYYEMLPERLPNHGEPTEELQKRGILLDGNTQNDDKRLLLQIFSENMLGPVFLNLFNVKMMMALVKVTLKRCLNRLNVIKLNVAYWTSQTPNLGLML